MSMPTTAAVRTAASLPAAVVQTSAPAATAAPKAKRTWGECCKAARAACTWKRIGLAAGAFVALFVVAGLLLPDAPEPTAVVEVTRAKFAPLSSADDGVSKAVVVARDSVDSGIDKVAAYLGW